MEILESQCVSAPEALESLDKKKKTTLSYEQKIALDLLKKSVSISRTDAKKLSEQLDEFKLRDKLKAMIINTLPATKEDLELVFAKERVTLKDDEKDKIVEAVKKLA